MHPFSVSESNGQRPFIRRAIAAVAAPIVLAIAFPIAPAFSRAVRVDRDDYNSCTEDLLAAGIEPQLAAPSCASVLRPEELGSCVADIELDTPASAFDALRNCRQVRRPLELSTCVVDIHEFTNDPETAIVLDRCRRSLLPERFSSCVVGISDQINLDGLRITPTEMMNTCLDASDRFEDTFPTFVPPQNEPFFDDERDLRSQS
ncbi:MAG: hypothetical protein SWY16_05265 [Cyanobacteriota bacterium]|nr:hypothetical protein [Cyanobacteriota bacterium]